MYLFTIELTGFAVTDPSSSAEEIGRTDSVTGPNESCGGCDG
jgi:hypothetical protein